MPDVTIITCTADNPLAFSLCERWVSRSIEWADLKPHQVQWIVSDGGRQPVRCTQGQEHVVNGDPRDPKKNFLRNMEVALQRVRSEKIVFCEHDDWYADSCLAVTMDRLDNWELVGEARAKYYNVATRRYRICGNTTHASLCQTGIRKSLVPFLLSHLVRARSTFVDLHLWKHAPTTSRMLAPESRKCVGLKGLPGKGGIGMGHRLDKRFSVDEDGSVLRSWIGKDSEVYDQFVLQPVS